MKILIALFISINFLTANILKHKEYSGSFTQTIINSSNTQIVYEGKIFVKNENKILWKYENPVKKDIYILNNDVIIDEPDLEQVIISKISNELNLFKMINESKEIAPGLYENIIKNTTYTIKIKDSILNSISYIDEIENKVSLVFKDVETDIQLDDKLFDFTPPSFYDIIRK